MEGNVYIKLFVVFTVVRFLQLDFLMIF